LQAILCYEFAGLIFKNDIILLYIGEFEVLYNPVKRDTLSIPSGPSADPLRPHLFIILTDRAADNSYLLVPISSVKNDGLYYDHTTILPLGCHSSISRESFVRYGEMHLYKHDTLVNNVASGKYTPKERFAESIFQQICAGIERSESSRPKMIAYFQENK